MNKKNILISLGGIAAIALIAAGTLWFLNNDKNISYSEIAVARGTVTKEIKATGPVKAASDVSLAWEKSGRIVAVGAKVGDKVQAGQTLLSLDNADLAAQLAQAKANLAAAQASYDALKNGARPEQLAMKKLALEKAQADLNNAYDNAIVTLNDAYAKNDDAVKTYTDGLFTNPDKDWLKLNYITSDSQIEINLTNARQTVNRNQAAWSAEMSQLKANPSHAAIDAELAKVKSYIGDTRNYLDYAFNIITVSTNMTPAAASSFKTGINAARTEITAASNSINAQTQGINSLYIGLNSVNEDYNLTVAGARSEDLAAQAARVAQAQAAVEAIDVSIGKNFLKAPIAGIVTKLEGKKGEFASPGVTVATIISDSQNEIEIRLSEADVAKAAVGAAANITLDAYGNQNFEGKIISIDPAQTTGADGLTGYKVRIQLTQNYSEIKTGMTANASVIAASKTGVLYLPESALIRNIGDYYAIKPDKTQAKVEIGLIGSDGKVEILSGLAENDTVLMIGK